MANTLSEALLVLTSWNTASDDLASQPTRTLVKDFYENTLKSDQVSKLYCTVLDVEVSEDQKKDAESVGVTLIPATRGKWSDPEEDPPATTWLLHHYTYFPGLKELQHIKHVVNFSSKTKNAAAAIHESLFPSAQFHQLSPPERNGVLFTFDVWSKDACGLAGYHRSIIQDFCLRKGRTGELLKPFSTVLDVKLTEDQKIDAEKCGVTLISAKEKSKGAKRKDLPNGDWLLKHESHYPDLGKLQNIKYVVGYAPKTGWAAIDIKETLFPNAKLLLVNHACPEKNCLLENGDEEDADFEEEMLELASKADVLFSIGPTIYEYFQNAYRANVDGRQLSDIPHEEILPKPGQVYFDSKPVIVKNMKAHSVLTYGQLDSLEAVKRCTTMAAAVRTVAKRCEEFGRKLPQWKICGVSTQDSKEAQNILTDSDIMQSKKVLPKLYSASSAPTLLRSIQQSHLCLPPSCYTDYSFEGLEAMAAGLPTTVQDNSHIAAMIEKHFEEHTDYCVVTGTADNIAAKITKNLIHDIEAFQQAKKLKEDLIESETVAESLAKFASIFKEEGAAETQDSDKQEDVAKTVIVNASSQEGTQMKSMMKPAKYKQPAETMILEDREMRKNTSMPSWMPVSEDTETTKGEDVEVTTAEPLVISVTAGVETKGTTAMHSGISGSGNFMVHVGLNEEPYDQLCKTAKEMAVNDSWKICQSELDKNADKVITNEASQQTVNEICRNSFGKVTAIGLKKDSLAISLNLPTLYNLYRVRHACLSGSFPDSFEPLLITDKMREEADKVGLQLKLKATYDQARFDELQLFFINRDGGGLKPVTVDDVIEGKDAEEIHFDGEDTDQKSNTTVTEGVADKTPTEHRQCLEDIQTKHEMERTTLESQLKEAKEEMATLEERCKELTLKLESTEQSLVMQCMDTSVKLKGLQSELEEKKKLINELEYKVAELEHKLEQSEKRKSGDKGDGGGLKQVNVFDDVIEGKDAEEIHIDYEDTDQKSDTMVTGRVDSISQGQSLEDIQSTSERERATLESQLKELKEGKATLEEGCKELTQKLESAEQSLVSQHTRKSTEREKLQSELEEKEKLTKKLDNTVEELEHSLEHSSLKKQAEKDPALMPQQPPQHHYAMSTGHMMKVSATTGQNPIPQEIQTSATEGYGGWSVILVNGQHQDQGRKFKLPCGLAFHRDKLVVCDTGNNIVQILNKDYTCDKVIGSFDGQFAKPFQPWSVAISHFNHYFILDDANKQIVVCDENGKIIQIITLPENIKVVFDIALMDDFVLVTLSLTPRDISRREDRDDRLVKYSQSGEYVTEVSGQSSVQTHFFWPVSVVVNSKNIIMVYDRGNFRIKCFDSDLNFLYQFGQSQIQRPRTELGISGRGYIAVDEDDNVYVCGFVRVHSTGDVIREWIVKYGCDGKWICELFKGDVRLPLFITVMGDKIGVVERYRDQIKVFSK